MQWADSVVCMDLNRTVIPFFLVSPHSHGVKKHRIGYISINIDAV